MLEELTWMEVRDAIKGGTTVAIVPTGGIEQNGPYVALGKHNFIVEEAAQRIASALGNALVFPVVRYVPEGAINPAAEHMLYAGTVSVREEVFRSVLHDIGASARAHGFTDIVFLGDSGGNQEGMARAAEALAAEKIGKARFHAVGEFYNYAEVREMLAKRGFSEHAEGIHDELAFTAQLLALEPSLVRYRERVAADKATLNGVALHPLRKFIEVGNQIFDLRVKRTLDALEKRGIVAKPQVSSDT